MTPAAWSETTEGEVGRRVGVKVIWIVGVNVISTVEVREVVVSEVKRRLAGVDAGEFLPQEFKPKVIIKMTGSRILLLVLKIAISTSLVRLR